MSGHLFGRDRRTSVAILGLGVGLALAGVGATAFATGANLGQQIGLDVQSGTLVLVAQVVLLGLVAAVAYANDGLVVCWLASLPVQVVATTGTSPTRTAFGTAVATLLVGTVGYALGRGAWLRRTGAPHPDDRVWTLVAGRDAARVRRSLVGAAVLGLAFFVAWAATPVLDVPLQEFAYRTFGFRGAFVLLTAVAAVQAYTNDGVVLSWAAAFAPSFGFVLGFGLHNIDEASNVLLLAITFPSIAAVVFGTAGFVLGAVLWRVRRFVAGRSSEKRSGTAEDGSEGDESAPTAATEQTHE